jgi:hypothetical protein
MRANRMIQCQPAKSAEHNPKKKPLRARNLAASCEGKVHDSGSSEGMGCRAKWAWTATVT